MNQKKIKIWISVIFLVFLLSYLSHAYILKGVFWPNSQATFYANGNTSFWNDAFIQALGRWNNLSNFQFHYDSDYSDPCLVNSENGWSFSNSFCGVSFDDAVAITKTISSYNQIIEADIVFNSNLYWNVYSGKMNWHSNGQRIFDFRRVAAHELGHALGLADQYASNFSSASIMYGIVNDDQPETPQDDDINGIRAIYGGGSSGTPGSGDGGGSSGTAGSSGAMIALRAANGQYLVAEGGGGQAVMANRDSAAEWEIFEVVFLGGSQIAIKAFNGQYVVAEGGGGQAVYANRDAVGAWETFEVILLGGNQIALKAFNGQYVVAEGGGGQAVYADSDAVGAWETFIFEER